MDKNITIISSGIDPKLLRFNYLKNARTKTEIKVSTQSDVIVMGKKVIADSPPMSFILDSMIVDVVGGVAKKVFTVYGSKLEDVSWIKKEEFNTLNSNFEKINGSSGSFDQDEFGNIVNFSYSEKENKSGVDFLENIKKSLELGLNIFPKEPIGIGGFWIFYTKDYCNELGVICDIISTNYIKNLTSTNIELETVVKFSCNKHQTEQNKTKHVTMFSSTTDSNCIIDLNTAEREVKSTVVSHIKTENNSETAEVFDSVYTTATFVY